MIEVDSDVDPSCEFTGDKKDKGHDWVVWVVAWSTQLQPIP